MTRREEALARTEQEIAKEKAEALGWAGERLERLLAELEMVASTLRRTDRAALLEARAEWERHYQRLRAEALRARQDLMIQREAVGFRRHAVVMELFPVPPARPWVALECGESSSVRRSQV